MAGDFEYPGADGKRYVGFLVEPEVANGAAVLIAHSAPGVADPEREAARRLAGLGYVALAADYHGDGAILPFAEMQTRIAALSADVGLLRDALGAGLTALAARPGVDPARVAATGYCFGGAAALQLARGGADLRAIIGFHSSLPLAPEGESGHIAGKVLILNGSDDPFVPTEERLAFEAEMDRLGIDWQMMIYGGVKHAYTIPGVEAMGMPGLAYDAATDRRSWKAMLALLEETIGA